MSTACRNIYNIQIKKKARHNDNPVPEVKFSYPTSDFARKSIKEKREKKGHPDREYAR